MSVHPGLRITADKTGYEFRFEGLVCVAVVDSGYDGAAFEEFILDLPRLDAEYPGWSVSIPEKYRGQHGHYVDGARFLTTHLPDGRETTLEFTYTRCPWKLARGLESRMSKGKGKGNFQSSPMPHKAKTDKSGGSTLDSAKAKGGRGGLRKSPKGGK